MIQGRPALPSLRSAWLFKLYIDPKEEYPVGHRMNAFLASMAAEMKGRAATFQKFPPKDIGLER